MTLAVNGFRTLSILSSIAAIFALSSCAEQKPEQPDRIYPGISNSPYFVKNGTDLFVYVEAVDNRTPREQLDIQVTFSDKNTPVQNSREWYSSDKVKWVGDHFVIPADVQVEPNYFYFDIGDRSGNSSTIGPFAKTLDNQIKHPVFQEL